MYIYRMKERERDFFYSHLTLLGHSFSRGRTVMSQFMHASVTHVNTEELAT